MATGKSIIFLFWPKIACKKTKQKLIFNKTNISLKKTSKFWTKKGIILPSSFIQNFWLKTDKNKTLYL